MPVKKTDLEPLELLGKGGYGKVYRVGGNPVPGDNTPLAYKEFSTDLDPQRRAAAAAVAFRARLTPVDRKDLDQYTVWPRELVLGPDGEISGLLMRLIPDDYRCELLDSTTGRQATKVRDMQWLGATRAQRAAAEIDLRDVEPLERLILLGKLVYAVGRLHKHRWVFGDLSFKNAAFALDPPRMILLDCDGAASLGDLDRKQASTPYWDPPECPSTVSAGQRRQQELQDDVTDAYKLGLAILRCLTPGKGVMSTRNPDRLTDQLNATGIALVKRALGADRADRPTAKELYAYFYEVVSAQARPPDVQYATLVTPLCPRGMDAQVKWQIRNADELTLTAGGAGSRTVDLSTHPDGYVIEKPESGPVFIELTNRFGTQRIDLGDITLYDPPTVDIGHLPQPRVPRLGAFTLEHMRPVLDAVPPVIVPAVPAVPRLPTVDLVGHFTSTFMPGRAAPVPMPRFHDAVIEASRLVADAVMDQAKDHAATERQAYLASQEEAGSAQP